jgi:hypothetical protein
MSKNTNRRSRLLRLAVATATLASPLILVTPASAATPTSFHVNFGTQTTAAIAGYSLDYGVAYTDGTGQGWEAQADGTSLSIVGNGRERNLAASPDKRYDTQMQMQETASSTGVKTPAQWEHALANGTYQVTVAVGDASATNSVDRITAELGTPNAVVLVNNFVPSAAKYFSTVTLPVTVSDGRLTLSALGGSNTKIDFVDVVPTDTTAPSASVSLDGNQVSAGVYQGTVTATISSTDEVGGSGLKSTTYSLDGSAATPYTAPFPITGQTDHTIAVTATDNAGNIGTTTTTFTIQAAVPDTTPPTASVSLSGDQVSTGVYQGPVTATINAADESGGSGLATTAYTLDGGASTPYTGPFQVTGVQDHAIVVSAADVAGNTYETTTTFTIQPAPDTTDPSASISLSGTAYSPGVYAGTVSASITATDNVGGSGVASTSYSLDGGPATPYDAPFPVTDVQSHSIAVTVKDGAGNTATATSTFSIVATDNTNPSGDVSLSGTVVSGDTYTGTVTATISASDEAGGSGLATTKYSLDGATSTAYTAPFAVTGNQSHTIVVTATDNAGNTGTATKTFTIAPPPPETVKPTASISLAGTLISAGVYQGTVTATVTAADNQGGSGLASTTYTLDGGAVTPYTSPVQVTAVGSHTINVTATDVAGNVFTTSSAFAIQPTGTASLTVVSPDDAVLANPSTPRLVFSAVRGFGATPAKAFTFTNHGTGALLVSNIAIGGTNASSWKLDVGQATSVTIAPGASTQISLLFTPTDPTGCADSANPTAIGDVNRSATLTYTTNDPAVPTGSNVLSGVDSCYAGGNNEPVLDQLLPALGYTDVVDTKFIDRRYIGPSRVQQNTDEIISPYWSVAVAGQPVSLTPIAHYGGPNTNPYQATGWYAQGSTMAAQSVCNSSCKTLWQFPADPSSTTYNQNQKLLPTTTTGVTTFNPTGNFGIFSAGGTDVNFSDDGLNTAHTTSNVNMPVPHYLHDMRIYPAYGPGHVAIPNTYIVGIDLSRVPSYKNNDYQDVILLMRNVKPAVSQATVLTATNDIANLVAGGSVTGTCGVSGFDGVMVNTTGTQCNAANIGFTAAGLALTSTSGQLPNGNQQNALYKSFDASRGAFTIDAQVVGPVNQLTGNYQQIGAFFGPDQNNFLKVEAEHNGGSGGDPHLTMFYDVKGVTSTVATVAMPSLTTINTLDLIIKGNTNVPDPLPFGDTYGVHNFPLDELTVWYSINGAAPVQIGTTTVFPADVTAWFSRAGKAGILVSNSGSPTPITATFSKFSVTNLP